MPSLKLKKKQKTNWRIHIPGWSIGTNCTTSLQESGEIERLTLKDGFAFILFKTEVEQPSLGVDQFSIFPGMCHCCLQAGWEPP